MPITKAFWQGKVSTRDFGARNLTVPLTSVPITSIYYIVEFFLGFKLTGLFYVWATCLCPGTVVDVTVSSRCIECIRHLPS